MACAGHSLILDNATRVKKKGIIVVFFIGILD